MRRILQMMAVGICIVLCDRHRDGRPRRRRRAGGGGGGGRGGGGGGGYRGGGGAPHGSTSPAPARGLPLDPPLRLNMEAFMDRMAAQCRGDAKRPRAWARRRHGDGGAAGGTYTGPHGGAAVGSGARRNSHRARRRHCDRRFGGNVCTGRRGTTVVTGGKAGAVTGPGGNTAAGSKEAPS